MFNIFRTQGKVKDPVCGMRIDKEVYYFALNIPLNREEKSLKQYEF